MNVSVVGELVARVRHTHAKYNDENAIVYKHLEEATRSTALESSVRQFKRRKMVVSHGLQLLLPMPAWKIGKRISQELRPSSEPPSGR